MFYTTLRVLSHFVDILNLTFCLKLIMIEHLCFYSQLGNAYNGKQINLRIVSKYNCLIVYILECGIESCRCHILGIKCMISIKIRNRKALNK